MVIIGIGSFIGKPEISVSIPPLLIDNVIITEDGCYIITEQDGYIEQEAKLYFILDDGKLDINKLR